MIRSNQTGLFLTRYPAYFDAKDFDPKSRNLPGAVWFNDKDLQSFAWVRNPTEARKVSAPADILGLFAGLTLDPHGVEVCRLSPTGDGSVSPVGTIADLITKGVDS